MNKIYSKVFPVKYEPKRFKVRKWPAELRKSSRSHKEFVLDSNNFKKSKLKSYKCLNDKYLQEYFENKTDYLKEKGLIGYGIDLKKKVFSKMKSIGTI